MSKFLLHLTGAGSARCNYYNTHVIDQEYAHNVIECTLRGEGGTTPCAELTADSRLVGAGCEGWWRPRTGHRLADAADAVAAQASPCRQWGRSVFRCEERLHVRRRCGACL